MGDKVFSLCFSLSMPLLHDMVRDRENIKLPTVDTSAGFILSQKMPTSAVNDALIPIKKEGILSIALWELSRTTQIVLHVPNHLL